MKGKLFDVYCINENKEKSKRLLKLKKEEIESTLDELFKEEGVSLVMVGKHGSNEAIFYHSVITGTYINDKNYEAPSIKKNGRVIMVFGVAGKRKVYSKYPRYYCNAFEYCDGELNIIELLSSFEEE